MRIFLFAFTHFIRIETNFICAYFFYVFLVPCPVFIRIFSILKTYHPVNVNTVKHPIKVIIWFCIYARCALFTGTNQSNLMIMKQL